MTLAASPSARKWLAAGAASAIVLAGLAFFAPLEAGSAPLDRIEVSARLITQFQIGRDAQQFGPLEFVGGEFAPFWCAVGLSLHKRRR